ncbi:MAG TPA: pantoate--beta-alanine ligase [Candidatus Didemnitutus sp.]|nr:pantoate--beta-alanine ligase [Candidatus Didemnitutus sp.]
MRLHSTLASWSEVRSSAEYRDRTIGFVPTMGALHEGHRSLLERARRECGRVVLSIFVNPTQFNDPTDLERYPRTLESDCLLANGLADDVVMPAPGEMYPDKYAFRVTEHDFSRILEGAHRPGHFDGVLTVVLKLLNIVRPHRAYFGEKDWQQLQLVRSMVDALFVPCEIVGCPTVREDDGLAKSSRNRRLSPAARALAPRFAAILRQSNNADAAAASLRSAGFEVDYVSDWERRRLGAIRIEGVRLIDNVLL